MFNTFLLVFILSLIFIWVIRNYAQKFGLIDIPNDRSIHTSHTPRAAGIAFFMAVMLVFSFFFFDIFYSYLWTFLAIFFMFLIGLWDDLDGTSPKIKFFIITISTILLSFDSIIIDNLGTFFYVNISLSWLALPFTIFVVSGFTNALNLIDGLDGLATSISIIILGAFFWIGYSNQDMLIMLLSGSFIASLAAFLFYNWYPASIFMGDSGSLVIGFVISVLGIKALAYIPAVSILYLGAIPIFDTLIVMIRRKRAGRSFFYADSCHMHHLLKKVFKENTQKTVLFLLGIQLFYSVFALQLSKEIDQGFLLMVFILNILVLYILLEKTIAKQKRSC